MPKQAKERGAMAFVEAPEEGKVTHVSEFKIGAKLALIVCL
jgi:hypothetical protein